MMAILRKGIDVIALLDYPSVSSFGRVPFVQRDPRGTLRIRGIIDSRRTILSKQELQLLVYDGNARRLHAPVNIPAPLGDCVAGWVGIEFEVQAAKLKAPPLPAVYNSPQSRRVDDNGKLFGHFWIDSPECIYDLQMRWIIDAAHLVFMRNDEQLADFMERVLPDAKETQAAIWHSRKTQLAKDTELNWLARLERDAGRPCVINDLRRRFMAIREQIATNPNTYIDTIMTKEKRYGIRAI